MEHFWSTMPTSLTSNKQHPGNPSATLNGSTQQLGYTDFPMLGAGASSGMVHTGFESNATQPAKAPRKRGSRIKYTDEMRLLLDESFQKCMFPSKEERSRLAEATGISPENVAVWFQNRRSGRNAAGVIAAYSHSTAGQSRVVDEEFKAQGVAEGPVHEQRRGNVVAAQRSSGAKWDVAAREEDVAFLGEVAAAEASKHRKRLRGEDGLPRGNSQAWEEADRRPDGSSPLWDEGGLPRGTTSPRERHISEAEHSPRGGNYASGESRDVTVSVDQTATLRFPYPFSYGQTERRGSPGEQAGGVVGERGGKRPAAEPPPLRVPSPETAAEDMDSDSDKTESDQRTDAEAERDEEGEEETSRGEMRHATGESHLWPSEDRRHRDRKELRSSPLRSSDDEDVSERLRARRSHMSGSEATRLGSAGSGSRLDLDWGPSQSSPDQHLVQAAAPGAGACLPKSGRVLEQSPPSPPRHIPSLARHEPIHGHHHHQPPSPATNGSQLAPDPLAHLDCATSDGEPAANPPRPPPLHEQLEHLRQVDERTTTTTAANSSLQHVVQKLPSTGPFLLGSAPFFSGNRTTIKKATATAPTSHTAVHLSKFLENEEPPPSAPQGSSQKALPPWASSKQQLEQQGLAAAGSHESERLAARGHEGLAHGHDTGFPAAMVSGRALGVAGGPPPPSQFVVRGHDPLGGGRMHLPLGLAHHPQPVQWRISLPDGAEGGKNGARKGMVRIRLTPMQRKLLEEVFAMSPFPRELLRRELGVKTGLSISQINAWFANKRRRTKEAGGDIAFLLEHRPPRGRRRRYAFGGDAPQNGPALDAVRASLQGAVPPANYGAPPQPQGGRTTTTAEVTTMNPDEKGLFLSLGRQPSESTITVTADRRHPTMIFPKQRSPEARDVAERDSLRHGSSSNLWPHHRHHHHGKHSPPRFRNDKWRTHSDVTWQDSQWTDSRDQPSSHLRALSLDSKEEEEVGDVKPRKVTPLSAGRGEVRMEDSMGRATSAGGPVTGSSDERSDREAVAEVGATAAAPSTELMLGRPELPTPEARNRLGGDRKAGSAERGGGGGDSAASGWKAHAAKGDVGAVPSPCSPFDLAGQEWQRKGGGREIWERQQRPAERRKQQQEGLPASWFQLGHDDSKGLDERGGDGGEERASGSWGDKRRHERDEVCEGGDLALGRSHDMSPLRMKSSPPRGPAERGGGARRAHPPLDSWKDALLHLGSGLGPSPAAVKRPGGAGLLIGTSPSRPEEREKNHTTLATNDDCSNEHADQKKSDAIQGDDCHDHHHTEPPPPPPQPHPALRPSEQRPNPRAHPVPASPATIPFVPSTPTSGRRRHLHHHHPHSAVPTHIFSPPHTTQQRHSVDLSVSPVSTPPLTLTPFPGLSTAVTWTTSPPLPVTTTAAAALAVGVPSVWPITLSPPTFAQIKSVVTWVTAQQQGQQHQAIAMDPNGTANDNSLTPSPTSDRAHPACPPQPAPAPANLPNLNLHLGQVSSTPPPSPPTTSPTTTEPPLNLPPGPTPTSSLPSPRLWIDTNNTGDEDALSPPQSTRTHPTTSTSTFFHMAPIANTTHVPTAHMSSLSPSMLPMLNHHPSSPSPHPSPSFVFSPSASGRPSQPVAYSLPPPSLLERHHAALNAVSPQVFYAFPPGRGGGMQQLSPASPQLPPPPPPSWTSGRPQEGSIGLAAELPVPRFFHSQQATRMMHHPQPTAVAVSSMPHLPSGGMEVVRPYGVGMAILPVSLSSPPFRNSSGGGQSESEGVPARGAMPHNKEEAVNTAEEDRQ